MQRTEIIIGSCLIVIGIAINIEPTSWVIYALISGVTMPPLPWHFWFILFFLLAVGAWFLVAGLKSKAIVSKPKT